MVIFILYRLFDVIYRMAMPEKPVCILCGLLIDILIKYEAVYYSCGHAEHADCYFFNHSSDNICQKCGKKSVCIILKYVAHF